MFRWLAGLGAHETEVDAVLARMDPLQWEHAVGTLPFLERLDAGERDRLKRKTAWFLASKSFSTAHDLVLTDDIMLSIAMQASLPILNLETSLYEGWTQVIVYPGAFLIPREEVDEAGVVHEYMAPVSGEAWDGGPVILSWDDVQADVGTQANVVIHEFAHKIDLRSGSADGIPGLTGYPDLSASVWQESLRAAFDGFRQQVLDVERQIPAAIDPDSELADPWFATLALDVYAATDEAEFFAVSSEAFFVSPARLRQSLPAWYGMLGRFYRQDPLLK